MLVWTNISVGAVPCDPGNHNPTLGFMIVYDSNSCLRALILLAQPVTLMYLVYTANDPLPFEDIVASGQLHHSCTERPA